MSDAPELLPCPFCGAVMEDWHGQSFTHPLVETREEACILAGLSFSYQHSRWNTEEVLRWNRRAALSDHPTVKALVAEAEARVLEGLLTDSTVQFAMGQRICCDGRECGCMGADVGSYIQHLADGYRAEAAAIRGETT